MRGVEAGQLDQRITIVRRVMGPDDSGQEVELSRTESRFHWAEIKAASGREVDFVNRVSAHLVYMVRVRDPLDVVETDLVHWLDVDDEFEIAEILKNQRDGFKRLAIKKVS